MIEGVNMYKDGKILMKEIRCEPVKIYLAQNLKFYRECYEFTQEDLAKYLNIDRSAYAYYESGRTRPKYDTLVKLSRLYKVSITDLLLEERY
jgi:transcriptional regulator with XRE-family HTH domain